MHSGGPVIRFFGREGKGCHFRSSCFLWHAGLFFLCGGRFLWTLFVEGSASFDVVLDVFGCKAGPMKFFALIVFAALEPIGVLVIIRGCVYLHLFPAF